jgi:hypothetical protein
VPIERGQISGDEIAAISSEVLEIPRAKIIDHRETRIREFFLQRKREIRADETGAAGHDQVRSRIR